MMIIHLNGWPGVGKHTIGAALAAQLKARFIHNHLLHDVAIACCGFEDRDRWDLYDKVQRAAYEALAKRQSCETFIMTNALCFGSARERAAWDRVVDLAIHRHVALIPVVLEAELAENERRLQTEERIGRKMIDPRLLRLFIQTDHIQKPQIPELLVLDVTRLSADQASRAIQQHLARLNQPVPIAKETHRIKASRP